MNSHSNPTVLIYVQHLLGVGHLQRAVSLANAIDKMGFSVDLISGGRPNKAALSKTINFHQLAPAHCANAQFSELLDDSNQPVDENWKLQRCEQLRNLFEAIDPDALVTETYPFGRRMMRFELLPLLKQARQSARKPLIISSIRDILQPKSREDRNLEIVDLIDQYYDQVLIHGDESVSSLHLSFSKADQIQSKLNYTGYIFSPPANSKPPSEKFDIIVSAGGSNTGSKIIQTAINSAAMLESDKGFQTLSWLILVSPAFDDRQFLKWQSQQTSNATVSRNRSDFDQLLPRCKLSISQAGYNTIMSILDANIQSIVIPFDDENEKEQTLRSQVLERHGALHTLRNSDLSVESLVGNIKSAFNSPRGKTRYKMQGAEESANLIKQWLTAE